MPLSANEQPHKMGRDTPAAPSQIAPTPKDERDVWLRDAMWRAFLRTWHIPEGGASALRIKESEKQRFSMLIMSEFPQRAFDGEIPIWGRRKGSFIWELIPRSFWFRNEFDHVQVADGVPPEEIKARAVAASKEEPDTSGDWRHFMTSKAVIERLYPSPR
jgi:hypothetical protein